MRTIILALAVSAGAGAVPITFVFNGTGSGVQLQNGTPVPFGPGQTFQVSFTTDTSLVDCVLEGCTIDAPSGISEAVNGLLAGELTDHFEVFVNNDFGIIGFDDEDLGQAIGEQASFADHYYLDTAWPSTSGDPLVGLNVAFPAQFGSVASGSITFTDVTAMTFFATGGESTAPEPGALGLCALGAIGCLIKRRASK